ncbi:hypothetical protein [Streptomyces sp. NPDC054863]
MSSTEPAYLDGMSESEQNDFLKGRGFATSDQWVQRQAREKAAAADQERQKQQELNRDHCVARDGSHQPQGTLRRGTSGSVEYVEKCAAGALGRVDWINRLRPSRSVSRLRRQRRPRHSSSAGAARRVQWYTKRGFPPVCVPTGAMLG